MLRTGLCCAIATFLLACAEDGGTRPAVTENDTPDAETPAGGGSSSDAAAETADTAGADAAADLPAASPLPDGGSDAPPPDALGGSASINCQTLSPGLLRTNHVAKCDRNLPKFYCDGRVVSPLAVKPASPFLLGMGPDLKNPLPAELDLVRLYDRVLTAEEIAAHARKQYEPCKTTKGCQLELDFDAGEAGTFSDTGPSDLTATIKGEVKTVPGIQGNAAHFDGKGWVELAHHPALAFTYTFSFEAWIRPSAACPATSDPVPCAFMRIFDKSNGLRLDRHAGGLRFQNTAHIFHAPGLEDRRGTWIHMAVTFDYERGIVFYKEGRESRSCRL